MFKEKQECAKSSGLLKKLSMITGNEREQINAMLCSLTIEAGKNNILNQKYIQIQWYFIK